MKPQLSDSRISDVGNANHPPQLLAESDNPRESAPGGGPGALAEQSPSMTSHNSMGEEQVARAAPAGGRRVWLPNTASVLSYDDELPPNVANGSAPGRYLVKDAAMTRRSGPLPGEVPLDYVAGGELPGVRMARVASSFDGSNKTRSAVGSPPVRGEPQSVLRWATATDQAGPDTAILLGAGNKNRPAKRVIPIWLTVCLLMLVPSCFVTVYLALSLHEASAQWSYATGTAPLLLEIVDLEGAFLNERLATTQLLAEPLGSSTRTATAAALTAARAATDEARTSLSNAALLSSHSSIRESYLASLRAQLAALDTLRYGVDSGLVLGSVARAQYTTMADRVVSGVVVVGRGSATSRDYLMLRDVLAAMNYAGLCRALGARVLRAGEALAFSTDAFGDIAPMTELTTQCSDSLRRALRDLHIEADGFVASLLVAWDSSVDAQQLQAIVYGLQDRMMTGSTYFPNMTAANYTAMATRAIAVLRGVAVAEGERVRNAASLRAAVLSEGLKLALTLAVSAVGVAVVARAQRMASSRVEAALGWTDRMANAVQAFIPQDFLGLMEVESILKLERGDRSRVRIATLFCDIRNFTGISEHMSNEQLFDWLQAHLMRMTRTTERHCGFVDKFIGDAVSSVFLRAGDAVRCAVRMQAATDALCFDLIAHNEDLLVRIGVGVHFGEAEVGVLGNDKHLTCVVISPEVSVAAQLESLTKVYGARIVITEQVREHLTENEFRVRPLGEVRLNDDSAAGYELFDVYDADALPLKEYKATVGGQWSALLAAQRESRLEDVRRLGAELQREADARNVVDLALEIKLRAAGATDDYHFD